jgi:hypothetical protein
MLASARLNRLRFIALGLLLTAALALSACEDEDPASGDAGLIAQVDGDDWQAAEAAVYDESSHLRITGSRDEGGVKGFSSISLTFSPSGDTTGTYTVDSTAATNIRYSRANRVYRAVAGSLTIAAVRDTVVDKPNSAGTDTTRTFSGSFMGTVADESEQDTLAITNGRIEQLILR